MEDFMTYWCNGAGAVSIGGSIAVLFCCVTACAGPEDALERFAFDVGSADAGVDVDDRDASSAADSGDSAVDLADVAVDGGGDSDAAVLREVFEKTVYSYEASTVRPRVEAAVIIPFQRSGSEPKHSVSQLSSATDDAGNLHLCAVVDSNRGSARVLYLRSLGDSWESQTIASVREDRETCAIDVDGNTVVVATLGRGRDVNLQFGSLVQDGWTSRAVEALPPDAPGFRYRSLVAASLRGQGVALTLEYEYGYPDFDTRYYMMLDEFGGEHTVHGPKWQRPLGNSRLERVAGQLRYRVVFWDYLQGFEEGLFYHGTDGATRNELWTNDSGAFSRVRLLAEDDDERAFQMSACQKVQGQGDRECQEVFGLLSLDAAGGEYVFKRLSDADSGYKLGTYESTALEQCGSKTYMLHGASRLYIHDANDSDDSLLSPRKLVGGGHAANSEVAFDLDCATEQATIVLDAWGTLKVLRGKISEMFVE